MALELDSLRTVPTHISLSLLIIVTSVIFLNYSKTSVQQPPLIYWDPKFVVVVVWWLLFRVALCYKNMKLGLQNRGCCRQVVASIDFYFT